MRDRPADSLVRAFMFVLGAAFTSLALAGAPLRLGRFAVPRREGWLLGAAYVLMLAALFALPRG